MASCEEKLISFPAFLPLVTYLNGDLCYLCDEHEEDGFVVNQSYVYCSFFTRTILLLSALYTWSKNFARSL